MVSCRSERDLIGSDDVDAQLLAMPHGHFQEPVTAGAWMQVVGTVDGEHTSIYKNGQFKTINAPNEPFTEVTGISPKLGLISGVALDFSGRTEGFIATCD